MSKQKYLPRLSSFCLLLFIFILPGCNTGTAGSNPAGSNSTSQPVGSPKGPGAANLTATALATPASTSCPAIHVTPASTSGWKIYQDTHFSFKFLIPPAWNAGSYVDNGNDYIVQVFPPGSHTPVGQAGSADPEHVSIAIAPPGSTGSYADDPNWAVEANTIAISGIETKIYDRTSPDCGEVNRGATATFGQRHFTFFLTTIPAKARNDIMLFLGMLQSFVYRT